MHLLGENWILYTLGKIVFSTVGFLELMLPCHKPVTSPMRTSLSLGIAKSLKLLIPHRKHGLSREGGFPQTIFSIFLPGSPQPHLSLLLFLE
jgi:hypothetical protein